MKNLVYKMSYQPDLIAWLIFFFSSLILTALPLGGMIILGLISYLIIQLRERNRLTDALVPAIFGITAHGVIFHLKCSPIEIFLIVLLLNVGSFILGYFLSPYLLKKNV